MAHRNLPFRPLLAASTTMLLTLLLGLIFYGFEAEGGHVWVDVYIDAAEICDGKNDCPLRDHVVGVTTRAATPFGSWNPLCRYWSYPRLSDSIPVNRSMSEDLVHSKCSALDEWATIQKDPVSAAASTAAVADGAAKGGDSTAPVANTVAASGYSTSGNTTSKSPDASNKSGSPLEKEGEAARNDSGGPLEEGRGIDGEMGGEKGEGTGVEKGREKIGRAVSGGKQRRGVTGPRRLTQKEKKARERRERQQRAKDRARKEKKDAKRRQKAERKARRKARAAKDKVKRKEAEWVRREAEKRKRNDKGKENMGSRRLKGNTRITQRKSTRENRFGKAEI
ncbi:unnamed protein product [Closterium sp. NIES-54]